MYSFVKLRNALYPPPKRYRTPKPMTTKTSAQVRDAFHRSGISIAEWARAHKLNANLVAQILAGRRACLRGESHRAAVLLGLKDGVIVSDPARLDVRGGAQRKQRGAG